MAESEAAKLATSSAMIPHYALNARRCWNDEHSINI